MSNPRGRAAHAMHEIFSGNLRNPAHDRRAGAMCQFPTDQVYSTTAVPCTCKCTLQMVILPTWHLRTWTSQACTLQMANPYGTAVVLNLVRYTGTSLYLGEWPQITPGALLRLYTTKIKTSTARRHELTSSCRGLPPTIVFERSARCTFKGTCTREHLSHAIHGQCLHVLYVSSVHVSDQHQNKYKYSCISRYSFINLYIIDTKFKFILSNIWISVQL